MVTPSTGNEAETAPKSDTKSAQSVARLFTEAPLSESLLGELVSDAQRWIAAGVQIDNEYLVGWLSPSGVVRIIAELRALRSAAGAVAATLNRGEPVQAREWRRLRDLLPTLPAPDGGTT